MVVSLARSRVAAREAPPAAGTGLRSSGQVVAVCVSSPPPSHPVGAGWWHPPPQSPLASVLPEGSCYRGHLVALLPVLQPHVFLEPPCGSQFLRGFGQLCARASGLCLVPGQDLGNLQGYLST